jgi:hypothetical protein
MAATRAEEFAVQAERIRSWLAAVIEPQAIGVRPARPAWSAGHLRPRPGRVLAREVAKKHHLGADRLARQRHWHALPDGREGTAYQEFLVPRRPLLARVVRDMPGLLCDPAYALGYPAPAESGLVAAARARYGVSIGDLVGAGLLRRKRSSSAQVTKAMPPPVPARHGTAGGRCQSSPGSRTAPGQGVTVIVTVWTVPPLPPAIGWVVHPVSW